jgi:hypothetical protein
MRVWEAAVRVLERTDNPAVMWGDEGLLHLIAAELGWKPQGWETSDRVLSALAKTPGRLVPGHTKACNGRRVRIFRLPEAGDANSASGRLHSPHS